MSIRSITTKAALGVACAGIALTAATGTANADDGMLRVGTDIQQGVYKIMPVGGHGYWELCADAGCRIDFDGSDATGLIDNDNIYGPSYLEIGPGVAYVNISDITFVS